MDYGKVNRRDFIKLLGLLPFLYATRPGLGLETRHGSGVETRHGSGIETFASSGNQNERPLNILIFVFDALSAMNMSLYGYQRETTPNLERIAENATVFHRHYAGGNFTIPGTASLLTGTLPWSHRAFHLPGTVNREFEVKNLFHLFSRTHNTFSYSHNPYVNLFLYQFQKDIDRWKHTSDLCLEAVTWVDEFFRSDHNVAYDGEVLVFRNGSAPPSSFFLSRFERLKRFSANLTLDNANVETFPRGIPNFSEEALPPYMFFTLEQSVDWVKEQLAAQPQPFVGYVHLLPPHSPYRTRTEFIDRFEDGWVPASKPEHFFSEDQSEEYLVQQRQFYDEFIAYVDAEFGRLYDFMEQSGDLENTCLVFTSDHGELFERGIYTHVTPTLYEPLLRIPLLVWTPGQTQRRDVFAPTSCMDLLPTLLHLTGGLQPEWCEGQLLPTYGGPAADDERAIYAVEAKENPRDAALSKATIAMVKGRYKLIHYTGYKGFDNEYELYDIDVDPEELDDLYSSLPSIANPMRDEMTQMLVKVNQPYH